MRYRPKHVVEYAAVRMLAGIVNILPYRLALALGWGIAGLSFLLIRSRRREAERRIRSVFGENMGTLTPRQVAWTSWRNLAFDIVEFLRIGKVTPEWIQTTTNAKEILGPLLDHVRTGRGAVITVPHMGNWETAALACHHAKIPIFSVSGVQKNPLVDHYLYRLRRTPGIETLPRGSGLMRDVLRLLRQGGFLAILPDVRMRTPDVAAPFLGGIANVASGAARFARQANVPIFPCYIVRHGWVQQEMHVTAPIWPDLNQPKEADVARMTIENLARIDGWIRAAPEQWFWFNRRWILDPLEPHAPPPQAPSSSDAAPAQAGTPTESSA